MRHDLRHSATENKQNATFQMEITEESCQELFPSETMVYLTPDAEEGDVSVITYSGHQGAHSPFL